MKAKKVLSLTLGALVATLVTGCDNKPEEKVASATCAELKTIKDPTQRAELLKKCPRVGSGFRPSDKREW